MSHSFFFFPSAVCKECMTEAFSPMRYLDYWERTSPQERCNRRPAYEEHDNRKNPDIPNVPNQPYEEHDVRKVDYAKLYSQPRPPSVQRQRSNPSPDSQSSNQRSSPTEEKASDRQSRFFDFFFVIAKKEKKQTNQHFQKIKFPLIISNCEKKLFKG